MLVVTLQAYQYRSGLKSADYRKTMDQYQGFANELAYLMHEEGLALYHQGMELQERQFYLFSYALIFMNWDPFLLWFIFMAHWQLNQNPPYIGKPAMPLKLFNDMGHFMGVQSSFKGNHPPFVEEIQQDMRISLEQAKHFVFLGYQLPEDDLIIRI